MATAARFCTVNTRVRHEGAKIKASRFIATVSPLSLVDDLADILGQLREEFSEANHHCFAYRLGANGHAFRSSDDGEPSGSAGRPILNQLDGRDLTDTVVVVSRIFGGTKLGVGGLIRAYGGAAAQALDLCELREVIAMRSVRLTFPYELSGPVDGVLAADSVAIVASSYGEQVELRLEIPESSADALLERIGERTSGRVVIEPI